MPLLWLSCAFLGGILLAELLSPPLFVWVLLACLGVGGVFAERRLLQPRRTWQRFRTIAPVPPGVLLLFLAIGGLRFLAGAEPFTPGRLAYYNDGSTYTVTARVSAPPDQREDAVYFELSALEIEDPRQTDPSRIIRRVSGLARARFPSSADWQMGDTLRFSAAPVTPSSGERFSYKDYLARQHISTIFYYPQQVQLVSAPAHAGPRAWLEGARQVARRIIFTQYPQPESGLLAGILLGLEHDLPGSLKNAYQQTGTAHIIAISGFNMAVLAGFFALLFSRALNRYWVALLSAAAIITYVVFVGGSPSVVRAAVMAVAAFGGHLLGRRQSGVNALGFTAALMCLFNPYLPGDVSFQLSFAATLGLVLLGQPMYAWLEKILLRFLPEEKAARVANPVSNYFLFTLAAQLFVLPVIAYHFGRLSPVTLLANPLVLPVQPLMLILGGASAFAGAIIPVFGKLLSALVWPLAAYTNRLVELLARVSGPGFSLDRGAALWLLGFLLLFIVLFAFRNFFTKLFRGRLYWVMFLLLLASVTVWSAVIHRTDGYLHLEVLRAGDESALFVKTPRGRNLLFDPGRNVNELTAAVSRRLSPWQFRLDQLWFTRPASSASLAHLAEQLPVDTLVLPPLLYQAGADRAPLTPPPDVNLQKLDPSAVVRLDEDLVISIIAQDELRAALLITHGEVSILIPGGVDYALIRAAAPAALEGLSALVLGGDDISYIPPRVWQALEPLAILWNSPALCPVEGWLSLEGADGAELLSDGVTLHLPVR